MWFRNRRMLLLLGLALAMLGQGSSFSAEPLSVDSGVLSALSLDAAEGQTAKAYLGITGNKPFTLPQVTAKTLIIEVLSMYCPHCQADAPEVNKLFHRIKTDPRLKDEVKMIGIGAGNTTFEVNLFKEKFQVPFPVFPDEEFAVQKACSDRLRTPTFVVMQRDSTRENFKVVTVHVGKIDNAETFLEKVKQAKDH